MKEKRTTKIIAIIALCITVVGITLGFAAFSNTLTISSSATVTPDSSDFDVNIYSVPDWKGSDDFTDVSLYTSDSMGVPISYTGEQTTATAASISNNGQSISISNISVNMKEPYDGASYVFMIKNEGQYDAYLDASNLEQYYYMHGTCTPGEGTTPEYVSSVCNDIRVGFEFALKNGDGLEDALEENSSYKLKKGEYIFLYLSVDYGYMEDFTGTVRADGPFTVDFSDIDLKFSSVVQ